MLNLNRRALLQRSTCGMALLATSALLAACNPGQVAQISSEVASDAGIIASGLQGALAGLTTLGIAGLTPAKAQTVGDAIAGIKSIASALAGAATASAAQPMVQQLEADLNAIVAALAGLPLPPQIALPLQAATVLLPIIEAAVGMVISNVSALRAAQPGMTADQARALLIGSGK